MVDIIGLKRRLISMIKHIPNDPTKNQYFRFKKMFSWEHFLDSRGIPYQTSGRNVARGNIVLHCPFCGSADESFHMEISVTGKGWRCFRRPGEHKGRNPTRLVQAILGCSFHNAALITGQSVYLPGDFMERVKAQLTPEEPPK